MLAPKLRLSTILGLRWSEHFDADLTRMTVTRHKTSGRTGTPQVTPISHQLRHVLLDARERRAGLDAVVSYRGAPVRSIKKGARRAAEAIGLTWGLKDGVTFHTIRHSIATLLATMGFSEALRKELMGHREIRTTQKYTHLAALVQVAPHEALADALPFGQAVTSKPRPNKKSKLLGNLLGVGPKVGKKRATIAPFGSRRLRA